MQDYKLGDTPIGKGDNFNLNQCPKNDFKVKEMLKILYASVIRSLMYAQVCIYLEIAYITGMLGKYLSNLGIDHSKATKRIMQYLQRIKDYILTYKRSD